MMKHPMQVPPVISLCPGGGLYYCHGQENIESEIIN